MIATRTLAVLSAACIVAAFALATLLPPMLPLDQLVRSYDTRLMVGLHDFVLAHMSPWIWANVVAPVTLRPCWLPLASLGIVFAGLSVTLASRSGVPRSHRKRS